MKRFAVSIDCINFEEDLLLEENIPPLCAVFQTGEEARPRAGPSETVSTLIDVSSFSVNVLDVNEVARSIREEAHLGIGRSQFSSSAPTTMRQKLRDIRVFCGFLGFQGGKKTVIPLRLRDGLRGADIVDATIKAFVPQDEKLRSRFSENPRHYKLFMADDASGEEEAPIQLDSICPNVSTFSLTPLPVALLSQFPSSSTLLPPPADDVVFTVDVQCSGKSSKRSVTVPADLSIEKLETHLVAKLINSGIQSKSLRIRYGPLELSPSDAYDFGNGCGCSCSVNEWTALSLYRFGVTEVAVEGRVAEDESAASNSEGNLDHLKRLDEEEARAYQQFDVIKINKFGIRQQRVIGVDGERVYNMRPLSEVGKTKNPERLIEDIEFIRDFPTKQNYCEIEYNKASKYDTDRIECRNAYDCAMLVEKLRMLKRIHGRRQDMKKADTTISRFFSRLGFGK